MIKYQQLYDLLSPVVSSFGYELWGVDLLTNNSKLIQIFVDSEKGVNVDECLDISKHVKRLFSVEMPEYKNYRLEVSSPGIERKFYKIEQLVDYVNNDVKLKLKTAVEGTKKKIGKVIAISGKNITLLVEGDSEEIYAWDDIKEVMLKRK